MEFHGYASENKSLEFWKGKQIAQNCLHADRVVPAVFSNGMGSKLNSELAKTNPAVSRTEDFKPGLVD